MKKILSSMAVIALIMIASVFFSQPKDVSAADTKAPVIDTSSITVSNKNPDRNGTVTISMKITDASEIVDAHLWMAADGYYPDDGYGSYNKSTGMYDFEVTPRYFGGYDIYDVFVADEYGNQCWYYNSKSSRVPQYYSGAEDKYADLSKGSFNVKQGGLAKENKVPVVNLSSLKVTNAKPKLNEENVYVQIKMTDDSPIACTYVEYAFNGNYQRAYGEYNSVNGYYEYPVDIDHYGKTEVFIISAEDAFGNEIRYADRSCSFADQNPHSYIDTDTEADMSAADMYTEGSGKDTTPPKLILTSFRVQKLYISRYESMKISFKIKEDTGLDLNKTNIWFAGMAGDTAATGVSYNKKTDRYETYVDGDYYGTHQIYGIELCDKYGNKTLYDDSNSLIYRRFGWTPEPNSIATDLSMTTYYVGLLNKKTDTFASNSTMDDTSKLKVEELPEKGRQFLELSQNGYNVKGYFEVEVTGKCDMTGEKTKVCFEAPKGFVNGDVLCIRHLLEDGTVQTIDAVVEGGKVCIEVEEFSPFIVEVKKAKDKNLFTKKGITYQVTGKSTVQVVGTSNKKAKKVTIPATVKAFKKTYIVTKIGAGAFKDYKKLKKITIGKNVKKIGKNAFKNCKKLRKIYLSHSKVSLKAVNKAVKGLSKKIKIYTTKK